MYRYMVFSKTFRDRSKQSHNVASGLEPPHATHESFLCQSGPQIKCEAMPEEFHEQWHTTSHIRKIGTTAETSNANSQICTEVI